MKKLVLLIGIFITQTLLLSNPVPEDTILQVATNWLELQTGQPHTSNDCVAYPNISNPSYWRVNFNPGFVIVSADNSCIPILAFSTQSNYPLQNEAAEDLLLEYSLQIEDAKNNNRSNADTLPIWNAILNQIISIAEQHDIGFETPQWSGNGPYNNYCPWDNHNLIDGHHQRSLVGCVATACAQICNYYKRWNYTLVDSDRYTSNNYNFECAIDLDAAIHDFPDFTNLNGYLDEVVYKYNNNIPLTDSDKAALSFACGILVHIQYSSPASSGGHGGLAYTKLNMHCQLAEASSYTSETWINLIKNQLGLDRPVEYHGQRTDVWGGHAYIITGFQTTNMNTTLNLVNWGRHWRLLEYWSLQPINPANDYPLQHSMLYGIAPNASVNQTIQLVNGSTDYSGIHIYAIGHDGVSKTLTTDNGVFEFGLPPGTYDFTITDIGNYYLPIQICDISIQTGTNYISPDPIVLTLKPNVVVVPTDVPTIPEAIDLVRNGGTVAIRNGSYTVSGLNWQDKHIKLQGQSQSGVIITNDPNSGLPAIQLSGMGIDNQDLISNVTFSNCDLTGTGTHRNGAAIELCLGAAPIITNCTFNQNRVGKISPGSLLVGKATGGAVFVSGNSATSQTNNTSRFVNCTFTNNYTLDGNGGGAVALYGQARFTGCEFINNKTIITDGIENPISRDMGGAVFIYTRRNGCDIDIDFDNCLFNNNKGRNEADDVFVANIEKLNTLRFNDCTFATDTPHSNGAKPAVKFLTDSETSSVNMHAHLILTNNKFLSCRKGAVYFSDYYGKNRLTFTGNVVASNMYEGYGVYSWYPDGTSPTQSNYFAFNNNTFSN
ncbi:MAG: C10 family peptidase, partial [Candidatus Cloacimonetes bacterium]|nr:C10 family peptidase [Candidatus Cloacimonadota bacterium]